MRSPRSTIAALAIGAGFAGLPAAAQAETTPTPAPPQQQTAAVSAQDRDYLLQANDSNQFEILSGRLAAERGRSRAVRQLGRLFVRDHTRQLTELRALATRLGVALPARPGAVVQARVTALSRLGKRTLRFDRTWLRLQITAHQESIAGTLTEALEGQNAEVRAAAIRSLPILGEHLGLLVAVHGGSHH